MRSTVLRIAIVGMALTVPTAAFAGPAPALVNQEGLLLRDGFPIDGETQNLTFRLCEQAEGGACVWTETHQDVEIRSGYYSVIMGSVEAIAEGVLDTSDIYLEIQIGADPPLAPRQRMVSTPFAVRATVADNADGDITPNSVTTGQLESTNGVFTNVTVNGLLSVEGNVTVAGNITAQGTVDVGLLTGNLGAGIVDTQSIADGAVAEAKFADGAVSNRAIATGAVTTGSVLNGTILLEDFDPSVLGSFADVGARAGDGGFVIDADTVDGVDSAQFLRSDIDDTASGSVTFEAGIRASVGSGANNGISFSGPTSAGKVELAHGGGESWMTLSNLGGAGDAVRLRTAGGPIVMQGGDVVADGGIRADGDLDVRHGDLRGNLNVGGSQNVTGDSSVRGSASVEGNLAVVGAAAVAGDGTVGGNLRVHGNATVDGVVSGAVVAGANGVVAVAGNIHAQGGDVEASRDLIAGRDIAVGGAFRSQGLIEPSNGRGSHGVVFPPHQGGRPYIQTEDGEATLRVGNTGGKVVVEGNQVALAADDVDIDATLRVSRDAEFRRDVEVMGNVSAIEITADLLTIQNEVNVAALLTADELQANTVVVDPDGDRNPNTGGVGILYADQISGRLADGMVTGPALADGAITTTKLGANSVNSSHIIDGQVRNPDLANNAVASNNIADGSIGSADLGANSVIASKIANDQIEDHHVRRNALGHGTLADGSVRSAEILDRSIQSTDLRDGAVDSRVLADNSITGADVRDGSLTGADIQDNTIHGSDIQDNTLTGRDIQDRTLAEVDYADNSVSARALAPNSVSSGHIQDGTVRTNDLGNNAVTGAKVADNSIGSNDIENNGLLGADIRDGTITGADIANGGVFGRNIANNAINSARVQDGTIDRVDLNFDPGQGGGGFNGGDIIFTEDRQGAYWKLGQGGPEAWNVRRQGMDWKLWTPMTGSNSMIAHWQNYVTFPNGVNLGNSGASGGGMRMNGQQVLSKDRDMWARRIMLTDNHWSSTDRDMGGMVGRYAVGFPRHSGGSRPQITSNPSGRRLTVASGYGNSDILELAGRGTIQMDGPLQVIGRTRHDMNKGSGARPTLFGIAPADKWNMHYNRGYDPLVFTRYLDGLPGAHYNRGVETIVIGRQPQWASDYRLYIHMDFDDGNRNGIRGPGAGTWEWWDRGGQGSRSHSWSIHTTGHHSGGTDPDNNNTQSRYNRGYAWANRGWRGRRCRWWRCWWRWYDGDSNTWVRFRWYWNPNGYPANAILAKGQFWYRRNAYNSAGGGRAHAYFDIWMYGQRGSRRRNHNWGCCGSHDTGWRKEELTPDDLYNRRMNDIRFESRNWAAGWWRGWSGTSQTQYWIDSMAIEILTASMSELQVYADATFWGSLHVKQDLKVDGRKFFIQEHPEDPNKEIAYIAIEGGEAGTYWRGSSRLEKGEARIPLPEHFSLVTADEGVTATATLREPGPAVYVSELTNKEMVVKTTDGSKGATAFDFVVMGVRRGFENHVPLRYRDEKPDAPPMAGAGGMPGGGGGMPGMMPGMMPGGGGMPNMPGGMGGPAAMNANFAPGH